MRSRLVAWLDRTVYPQFADSWDNEFFRHALMPHVRRSTFALDLGAGAGIVAEMNLRGLGARIAGVDLDPRVETNPFLDEGRLGRAEEIPYPDASFDLVFSANVLEHLTEPERAFREIARVLRPGGRLLVKTPNRWHYVPLIARWTPHRVHEIVASWRGRQAGDTFPTLYRANSGSALRRLAASAGLEVIRIRRVEGRPEYLRLSAITYAVGIAYERIVNATEILAPLRLVLYGEFRKT